MRAAPDAFAESVPLPGPSNAKPPDLGLEMELFYALFEKQLVHPTGEEGSALAEAIEQCAEQLLSLLQRARQQWRQERREGPKAEGLLASCLRMSAVLAAHAQLRQPLLMQGVLEPVVAVLQGPWKGDALKTASAGPSYESEDSPESVTELTSEDMEGGGGLGLSHSSSSDSRESSVGAVGGGVVDAAAEARICPPPPPFPPRPARSPARRARAADQGQ